jgi:hypothetical protein
VPPLPFLMSGVGGRGHPASLGADPTARCRGVYWHFLSDDRTVGGHVLDRRVRGGRFDSDTGRPSFWQALPPESIAEHQDRSWFMARTEVVCGRCDALLGRPACAAASTPPPCARPPAKRARRRRAVRRRFQKARNRCRATSPGPRCRRGHPRRHRGPGRTGLGTVIPSRRPGPPGCRSSPGFAARPAR